MIAITDRITIDATPSEVFNWFEHLDENYLAWHPSHVTCRYLKKHSLQVGAVLYTEEYLHGKLHKLRFLITKVIPDQEFQYRIAPGLSGGFKMTNDDKKVDLEAEIRIGWNIPVFSKVIDAVLKTVLSSKISDLQQHMNEEGINLRALFAGK